MDKKITKKRKSAGEAEEEKPVRKIKVIKPNSEVLIVEAKKADDPLVVEPVEEAKPKRASKAKTAAAKKATKSADEETVKEAKPKKATARKTKKAAEGEEVKPKRKYTRKTKIEIVEVEQVSDSKPVEYVVAEAKPEELEKPVALETADTSESAPLETAEREEEKSPIFKELAAPKLPMMPSENRARLQMQSPNRVFFYWSVKDNPYERMHKTFGARAMDYRLTAKLINLSQNREEMYPVEATGSWWFNVDSNSSYRAEIGFAAHNRPFVRLMFSNTVETPRSSPSPRYDWTPDFYIPNMKFAQALDASGYSADAREIVEAERAEESTESIASNDQATQSAYTQITGNEPKVSANEIRYVLFALASGVSLESLRGYISPSLYGELEEIVANLNAQEILGILHEHFGFNPLEEEYEEVEMSGAVYGASIVNFPKGLRKKRSALPPGARKAKGPAPISSFVNR